jgi:hypothetical protein
MTTRRTVAAVVAVAALAAGLSAWVPSAALTIALCILFLIALPELRPIASGAAWAIPLLVALLAVVLDVVGWSTSEGPVRYLGTALVLGSCVALRIASGRPSRVIATRLLAGLLFGYGMVGAAYGRFVDGVADGAFPIVLPISILVLGYSAGRLDRRATLLALKVTGLVCSAFGFLSAAARFPNSMLPLTVFNHEKAFIIALAVGCGIAARSLWLCAVSAVAATTAFLAYPAASYVVAIAVALLTVGLMRLKPNRVHRISLAIALGSIGSYVAFNMKDIIAWTADYFAAVGKVDNGSARLDLYRTAVDEIMLSPLFSKYFAGNVTVVITLSGRPNTVLPVHNDYLSVALGGGVVAVLIMISILMLANGMALLAGRRAGIASIERRAILALQGAMNAAAATAFANPIFMNPGSSTAVWAIIAALMVLSGAVVKSEIPIGVIEENGSASGSPLPRCRLSEEGDELLPSTPVAKLDDRIAAAPVGAISPPLRRGG